MRRFLPVTSALVAAYLLVAAASACSGGGVDVTLFAVADAGRGAKIVRPDEAGTANDGAPPPATPSCPRYCELVDTNCTGANKQYATKADCLAFCTHLAEGKIGQTGESTIACRQYYAGSPALANPSDNCRAAGPFGGDNKCGSRCTAFCDVAMSACTSTSAAYATGPDCDNACTGYVFVDASIDGGGEGPSGPESGDTLNCRLYWLRRAVNDAGACAAIREQSSICN
jgi:hypothetical protein